MKNSTVLAMLAVALSGCAADDANQPSTSNETDNDLLFLAYSTASLHPESFDATAGDIRGWSSNLLECATNVQARLSKLQSSSASHCQDLEEQDSRTKCYSGDIPRISLLVDAVVQVVEGKAAFASTPSGAALTLGKQLLGDEEWDNLQTEVLDMINPLLACN